MEIELNTEVLKEWADKQGPNRDPATVLAAQTGMSVKTAKKILIKRYVPGPTIRANVSFVTGIPETELWRPKRAA